MQAIACECCASCCRDRAQGSGFTRTLKTQMRILHAIDHLDLRRGGPPHALVALANAMAAAGHDVVVATPHGPDTPPSWRGSHPRIRAIDLPASRTPFLPTKALTILRRELASVDVVHLHGVWEPLNMQVARLARSQGVPYVISLRGMLDDWSMAQRGLKKRLHLMLSGRSMLSSAAAIHCTAKLELEQSSKWFPSKLGRVIPNLLELSRFDPLPGPELARRAFPALAGSAFRLLFFSRLSPKKGFPLLVDAAEVLRKKGLAVEVVVAGTGDPPYEAECKQLVASKGMSELVHFLGYVGGELKTSVLQACDLMVLPTSQENFGFVFFESLAAGVPVVTTDLVDTAEEIRASGAGFIVKQDAAAIVEACEAAIAEGPALRERGQAGRAWTFENLDPMRIAGQFERLYRSRIDAARARQPR